MNIGEVKIVADSSADMEDIEGILFSRAAMKIITAEREFVDNGELDVAEMVDFLSRYKGKSSSSCPNASDWIEAFGEAKYVFCVPITATLSGSYNSAVMAKKDYEEKFPDRRVFVLNTLTAGPEMTLMALKLRELILEGLDFDSVCEQIERYMQNTGLLFMLASLKNFANNGRISPIVAKAVGLLGIRLVGKASDKGDLQPLDKCRGEKSALKTIISHLKSAGLKTGRVMIGHCFNEAAADELSTMIAKEFAEVQVEIHKLHGLCSFYAEKGGLLVGFEKM
ncbi:MAG: DegV family protein [Clostridia bacterium]|nr:DegV family protein [Clostridia bacterium]